MSHYKNLFTGEYVMTEANALRHYIKLAKKALKAYNIVAMKQIYKESTYHIDIDKCFRCKNDDFGYCYFRGKNSIPEEQHFVICFTNWIKSMEYELNTILKRKGKVKEN